jgi:hypothetical protein
VFLVGVDCAADPRNVGIATAMLEGHRLTRVHVDAGSVAVPTERRIAAWIADSAGPALLALDAPLGWPVALGASLCDHTAGTALAEPPNRMFRRRTDDVIHTRLGKQPLDVGADRIARCAHAALALLDGIRRELGHPIPLAWTPGDVTGVTAIEVYPAATLASRRIPARGYKGAGAHTLPTRGSLVEAIGGELEASADVRARMVQSDHILDAVVCILAGRDFVHGQVIPPDDLAIARREGWIWARPPV